jgi:hypothetical protein
MPQPPPQPRRAVSTDEMLECLRLWCATVYPGKDPKRMRLYFRDADPEDFVALPIPTAPRPRPGANAAGT